MSGSSKKSRSKTYNNLAELGPGVRRTPRKHLSQSSLTRPVEFSPSSVVMDFDVFDGFHISAC